MKRKQPKYRYRPPEITAEQLSALRAYAQQHGRSWKQSLRDDWMKAGSRTFDGPWAPLQQLRNTHGPTWLVNFRMPKEEP